MWPIFVINLDRAQDRMIACEQQMRRAGLAFERVPACDWKSLGKSQVDACIASPAPPFAKRPLTPPEVACFISHRKLWGRIAAVEQAGAFIFEDDCQFEPRLRDLLAALSVGAPDWDVLKLYSNKHKRLFEPTSSVGQHRIGVPGVIPMSTVAYAITREAAANLYRTSFPFTRPVDLFLKHWWEHGACIKLVVPPPVGRREDHLETSEIRHGQTKGGPVSRFVRNTLYQLAFKINSARHASQRTRHRRWFADR